MLDVIATLPLWIKVVAAITVVLISFIFLLWFTNYREKQAYILHIKERERKESANPFTIEVEKMEKDKQFDLDDLKVFHSECYGGEAHISGWHDEVTVSCRRCGSEKSFSYPDEDFEKSCVLTAMDGKKREFGYGVCIIQRDLNEALILDRLNARK